MDAQPYKIFHYESIDSTNEEAKRLLQDGAISAAPLGKPVAVLAEEQTAGKGTQGRQWVSVKGAGLYLSIVHMGASQRDSKLPVRSFYTQAAGLACQEAIMDLFGVEILLKPINDLYARCPQSNQLKKLGGILVESSVKGERLTSLVTGVGVNLLAVDRVLDTKESAHPDILPISLEELCHGLAPQVAIPLKSQALLTQFVQTLIGKIDLYYSRLLNNEEKELAKAYETACQAYLAY